MSFFIDILILLSKGINKISIKFIGIWLVMWMVKGWSLRESQAQVSFEDLEGFLGVLQLLFIIKLLLCKLYVLLLCPQNVLWQFLNLRSVFLPLGIESFQQTFISADQQRNFSIDLLIMGQISSVALGKSLGSLDLVKIQWNLLAELVCNDYICFWYVVLISAISCFK